MYWQTAAKTTSIECDSPKLVDKLELVDYVYEQDDAVYRTPSHQMSTQYVQNRPVGRRVKTTGPIYHKQISVSERMLGQAQHNQVCQPFTGSQSQLTIPQQGQQNYQYMSPNQAIYPNFYGLDQYQFSQSWGQIDLINEEMQLSNDMDQLCGNQILSRKIQKMFEFGTEEQRAVIFNKIERSCLSFAKDIFGNYTVQRVFEKGTQDYRMKLFNKLKPQFYELSKNNFGCRVVQKILECIQTNPNLQDIFLDQIKSQVKPLLYDIYGNYVILKCLDTIQRDKLTFLLQPMLESVQYMVQQTYGCRILQKSMELFPQEEMTKITKLTISMCNILCHSEYGNYIIQYVLKNGPQEEQEIIYNLIKTNLHMLSLNKYGSNTVEKYIEQCNREALKEMTLLLTKPLNMEPFFVSLGTHPFGNYVLKKYLIMSDREVLEPLITLIKQSTLYIEKIKTAEFGQRVYMVLEKLLAQ